MSEQMEMFDPTVGAQGHPLQAPGYKVKKLCTGAPGHIRLVNKTGSVLSVGARAVMFLGWDYPLGLDPEEDAEFRAILDGIKAKDGGRLPSAVEQLNLYCETRANRTIVEVYPFNDRLLVFMDVFLDGEELDDYMHVNDKLSTMMREVSAERAKFRADAAAAEAKQAEQDAEDLALGRKVREQKLQEKVRTLEATVASIKKAANKLAKKAGVKNWEVDSADQAD